MKPTALGNASGLERMREELVFAKNQHVAYEPNAELERWAEEYGDALLDIAEAAQELLAALTAPDTASEEET